MGPTSTEKYKTGYRDPRRQQSTRLLPSDSLIRRRHPTEHDRPPVARSDSTNGVDPGTDQQPHGSTSDTLPPQKPIKLDPVISETSNLLVPVLPSIPTGASSKADAQSLLDWTGSGRQTSMPDQKADLDNQGPDVYTNYPERWDAGSLPSTMDSAAADPSSSESYAVTPETEAAMVAASLPDYIHHSIESPFPLSPASEQLLCTLLP